MLVHIYLVLLVTAIVGTWIGMTPPERRVELVQPVAQIVSALLFILLAVSSLNVEVPDGAGGTLVYDSLYLVIVWNGFALLNVVGLVYGVFEQAFTESESQSIVSREVSDSDQTQNQNL
jgi:putative Mn2+ efflux pump MntP